MSFNLPHPGIPDYALFAVYAIFIIITVFYFTAYFNRIIKHNSPNNIPSMPISLVVAARNELPNLQKIIPALLSQQYPEFELIIADDGSTDGSSEWLTVLAESEPKLKIVYLDPEYVKMHGKKIALTLAYKKAKYNHFVLTDADCIPNSDKWLQHVSAGFENGKEIVIGYSPYLTKKGFINSFIRFETLQTAMHFLGMALAGKPYMGVGRNLAYSRNVYNQNNGFASHSHIPAGDDDLFVQEAANSKNTSVVLHEESFVSSIPKSNWKEYRKQKKRHMWVGKFYKPELKRKLAVMPVVRILFWLLLPGWFIITNSWIYPLIAAIVALLAEWILTWRVSKKLKTNDIMWGFPIWHFTYSWWYLFASIGAFFAKKPKW